MVSIARTKNGISYTCGFSVDADGSPIAYAPKNSGLVSLDYLENAGKSGNWYGLACDEHGQPYIQGSEDPSPHYYVSTTALTDHSKPIQDPNRYVDSCAVCYVSVASDVMEEYGIHVGDLAYCVYQRNECPAIVADVSPKGKLGEGSIALAAALGINSDAKNGGIDDGVIYYIFSDTRSNPAYPRDFAEAATSLYQNSKI